MALIYCLSGFLPLVMASRIASATLVTTKPSGEASPVCLFAKNIKFLIISEFVPTT